MTSAPPPTEEVIKGAIPYSQEMWDVGYGNECCKYIDINWISNKGKGPFVRGMGFFFVPPSISHLFRPSYLHLEGMSICANTNTPPPPRTAPSPRNPNMSILSNRNIHYPLSNIPKIDRRIANRRQHVCHADAGCCVGLALGGDKHRQL